SILLIFFFQAEDGIRDRNVTGVQTCALPISAQALKPHQETSPQKVVESYQADHTEPTPPKGSAITGLQLWDEIAGDTIEATNLRSEERRVGKEYRSPSTPTQDNKNRRVKVTR